MESEVFLAGNMPEYLEHCSYTCVLETQMTEVCPCEARYCGEVLW